MRTLVVLLAVFAAGLAAGQEKKNAPQKEAPVVPPRQRKSETVHLFDGKSLAGWERYTDLWPLTDGVIVAKNTSPLKGSSYLLTKNKYSDLRVTLAAQLFTSETHS